MIGYFASGMDLSDDREHMDWSPGHESLDVVTDVYRQLWFVTVIVLSSP